MIITVEANPDDQSVWLEVKKVKGQGLSETERWGALRAGASPLQIWSAMPEARCQLIRLTLHYLLYYQ